MQPQHANNLYGAPYTPPSGYGNVPVEMPKPDSAPKLLIVVIVLLTLICLAVLAFAVMMFGQAQDYKNNVDKKVQVAVAAANEKQQKELETAFAEQEKSPLKTYITPAPYGAVEITYPKTWSAQVSENPSGTNVDAYFHLNYVPNLSGETPFYARLQVVSTRYENELGRYKSALNAGSMKSAPFVAEAVPSVTGIKLTGTFPDNKKGTLVLLPLRDKTIRVWTENDAAAKDFESIVLKQLTFSP